MDLREIIHKARETAKNPDEVLLSERFEEYLDLVDLQAQVTQKEMLELKPRLKNSLNSLKEVADRVALSYGMDPETLIQFFMGQSNIGMPKIQREKEMPRKANKIRDKKVRV